MLSGGLGNPFAAMLAQPRPALLTLPAMPTATSLTRNPPQIPANPYANMVARPHSFATSGSIAGAQLNNHPHVGGFFSQAAAAATNRSEALRRYRQKRSNRHFEKTIRYASRQDRATKRPRVKGRFIKQEVTDSHMTCNGSFAGGGDYDGPEPATTATTAMARADTNNTTGCGGSVCSGESSEVGEEVEMSSASAAAGLRGVERAGAPACLEQQGSRTLDTERHHTKPVLDRCGSTAGRAVAPDAHHPAMSEAMHQQQVAPAPAAQRAGGVKRILSCASIHTPGQCHLPQGCTTDVSCNQAGDAVAFQPATKLARTMQHDSSQLLGFVPSFLHAADPTSPGQSAHVVPVLTAHWLQHQQSFSTATFQAAGASTMGELRRYSTVQQQLQPIAEGAQLANVKPAELMVLGCGGDFFRADSMVGVMETAATHHPAVSCGSCDVVPSAATARDAMGNTRQAAVTGGGLHMPSEAEEVCSSADARQQHY